MAKAGYWRDAKGMVRARPNRTFTAEVKENVLRKRWASVGEDRPIFTTYAMNDMAIRDISEDEKASS